MWSPDGKTLYFVTPARKLAATPISASESFSAGDPQPLFLIPVRINIGMTRSQYDLAPDGKRFVVNRQLDPDAESPPVTLVQNWTEKLGR